MIVDDYMKLSKRRLAELLAERDAMDALTKQINAQKQVQIGTGAYYPPCFAEDGMCTNPFKDCINCPKRWTFGGGSVPCYGDNVNIAQQ